ncbi:hypothetical protein A5646_03315 [Mycobacterium sp. 1245499.0]|uniref:recombinase RecT n=1 Tax=Mycobacterium sp. 1245499.0 TaxID=1834074 RepID=UPI0007FE7D97|nr:recombinase RecT [Mycobacterium sp. 1245499.0]OBK92618.1 hypothetical protein A5646_03315 [Mycobacterium sp. 1245499.0]
MTTQPEYKPVAQGADKQMTTGKLLKMLEPEIGRALPKGMDPDRICRLVMTEVRKNPMLTQCTQESFAGALLTASALGLEPGVNGEAWLVPYRDRKRGIVECQFIMGYNGVAKLFWQSPHADRLDAQLVCANDHFRYVKGLSPILEHVESDGDRGDPIAYYAIVGVKGAQPMWDVFKPEAIAQLRGGRVGTKGDIDDPQRWMERKTALKQVLKLAPKSTRLDLAIRADERSGSDLYKSQGMEVHAIEPGFIETEAEPETQEQ